MLSTDKYQRRKILFNFYNDDYPNFKCAVMKIEHPFIHDVFLFLFTFWRTKTRLAKKNSSDKAVHFCWKWITFLFYPFHFANLCFLLYFFYTYYSFYKIIFSSIPYSDFLFRLAATSHYDELFIAVWHALYIWIVLRLNYMRQMKRDVKEQSEYWISPYFLGGQSLIRNGNGLKNEK